MMFLKKCVVLVVALTGSSFSCVVGQILAPTGESRITSYDFGGKRLPVWSGGALLAIDKDGTSSPIIHAFGQDGRELSEVALSIPEAVFVNIEGVARLRDGALVACGTAHDKSGRSGGFVARISLDGKTIKTSRVYPYHPVLIAVRPDGQVWTRGWQDGRDADGRVQARFGDFIKRFDQFGVVAKSALNGMSIPREFVDNLGYLAASAARVAWYPGFGETFFEIANDGTVSQYPGVALKNTRGRVTGLAITSTDQVFVSVERRHEREQVEEVYTLNRNRNSWDVLDLRQFGAAKIAWLYGGERDQLVFAATTGHLLFYRVRPDFGDSR